MLKNFLEQYIDCPICNMPLSVIVRRAPGSNSFHNFSAELNANTITVKVISTYFINNQHETTFYISLSDKGITYDKQASQFLKLYHLCMCLEKRCQSRDCCFSKSVDVSYNGYNFNTEAASESFGFMHKDTYYFFTNDFTNKVSLLSVQSRYSETCPSIKVPFIPFHKFDFSNPEKLFSKINAINLLA